MKTNIFKKLVAALFAVTMSMSIIIPTKAIKFNETLINFNIPELENASSTIPSCLQTLEIIRKDISNSTENSQDLSTKEIIYLLIDDLSNKLNKIHNLEIKNISSLKDSIIKLNDLNVSLNSLLAITTNDNKISTISDGLFEARSNLYQIYDDLLKYNDNTIFDDNNIGPMTNNHLNPTNINNNYNSENEKWWDEANNEIDALIAQAESNMQKKNTNIQNLYEKFDKLYAGYQSKNNCWLFAAQNIANYFLSLYGQNPIRKFDLRNWNGPIDTVENEFLRRMPNCEYFLRNGQTQCEMRQYLQTYEISADEISILNYQPNNQKHKRIMKKIAYFLLVHHFSFSDTPIATNVGYHWIAVAGIDINNKYALLLDPMKTTPNITTLDDITDRISTMSRKIKNKNELINHILILFPHKCNFYCVTSSNYPGMNWNRFKSEILSTANR